ncbi:MAG: LLM class flavin-dependent oxidoreductase [Myxococcota bacterium]
MQAIGLSVTLFRPDPASALQVVVEAERAGVDAIWLPAVPMSFDPLTLLAAAALRTDRIVLGTGIVPTYPRHPATLVSQALAVAALAPERLRLGVGVSHPFIIGGLLGLPFHPPIAHLREYVTVVRGLLERGRIDFDGHYYNVHAQLAAPPTPIPIPISALRPRMFELAGEISDGAIAAWCPVPYLIEKALPALARGAHRAGRPRPPLIANVPIVMSDDREAVRAAARKELGMYLIAPAYADMFRQAGFAIPADLVPPDPLIDALFAWGTPARVAERLRAAKRAGVDELMITIHPARDPEKETSVALELLGSLCAEIRGH